MLKILHTKCEDVAFYYVGPAGIGPYMKSEEFVYPNGEHPVKGSFITCGSCGDRVTADELKAMMEFAVFNQGELVDDNT